eukprot:TRINITY_DN18553_c0_g1_i1.p1 TRINITY_DN18553_c0_g1~~TRINITY_DN18553_c0_g1_i1.p1  ORF type:complete len:290 (+),score=30.65 TRINITY_DN18553_c0_g1_i1:181-1050(+)
MALAAKNTFCGFCKRCPRTSALVTSVTIGFAGDTFCQKVVERAETHDLKRSIQLGCFAGLYNGVIYAPILRLYASTFTASRFGTTGSTLAKTAADNFVTSPALYFPLLYSWLGVAEGKTLQQTWDHAKASYLHHNIAHCMIWIPTLAVCFATVPVHLQVLYVNCVSFGWTCAMSYISHGQPTELSLSSNFLTEAGFLTAGGAKTTTGRLVQEEVEEPVDREAELELCSVAAVHITPETMFDVFVQRVFSEEELVKMSEYRQSYGEFRRGAARGCKGEEPWREVLDLARA